VPVEHRVETFKVRQFDQDTGEPLPMSESVEKTTTMIDVPGHGILMDVNKDFGLPKIVLVGGKRILFRWQGMATGGSTEMLAWLGFNRAETVEDFAKALDEYAHLISFNWVAADADDILYRVRMDVPKRDLST